MVSWICSCVFCTSYLGLFTCCQLRYSILRLGLFRDAEKQLKSALRDEEIVDTYLYLCKVYVRLDQPLTAIEVYLKVGKPDKFSRT